MSNILACGGCGSPVPPGQAVWGGIRALPDHGRELIDPYCSDICRAGAHGKLTRRPRCAYPDCGQRFTPKPGPGRPQRFCHDRCRRAAERMLNRALKALARGTMPRTSDARRRLDELTQARYELEHLVRSWQDPTVVKATTGVTPLPPPDAVPQATAEMYAAARRRLADIDAEINGCREHLASQADAERQEQQAAARSGHLRARQQVEQNWREQLLFLPGVNEE